MSENKNSAARIANNNKWDNANYDKILVRLPKGTKEKITASGMSLNAFCREAIMDKLNK